MLKDLPQKQLGLEWLRVDITMTPGGRLHDPEGSMYLYSRYLSLKGVPIWVL